MEIKKRIFWIVYSILLILLIASGLLLKKYISELPAIEVLEEYTPSLATRFYDINGELISELFTERRVLAELKDIPVDLQNATIAIEDTQFFRHWGINLRGLLRAFLVNFKTGRIVQGGSSITQQLSKLLFLTPERTWERKIKELILTVQLEYTYSKQEILQMYFNQIYYGSGAYGIEAAARIFFGKPAKELNLAECALLAGLPSRPTAYSPFLNPRRALTRRAVILRRMRKLGFISKEDEEKTNAQPLNLWQTSLPTAVAPYFIEHLRQQLETKYGSQMLYKGGLQIYTTLDLRLQKSAEKNIEERLSEFDLQKNLPRSSTEGQGSTATVKVQGALVCLDPKTGQIRALTGGRSFSESQFNRATQARRQPGSAFKPFIYLAALENGYSPTSIIEDEPVVYVNDGYDWRLVANTTDFTQISPELLPDDPEKIWVPQNYHEKYYGPVLLRKALEYSLNVCAVKVLDQIRPPIVIPYAQKLGIESPLQANMSLALGTNEVTLLEMVSAFATFDNLGIRVKPYGIIRVEDPQGNVLEKNLPQEEEIFNPPTMYLMTNLLRGVVENGTGKYARWLNRPAAGKTGTTNDFTDAWFIGYTPQLVAGVWVGYDDRHTLGNKMSGGVVACPIWTKFMKEALAKELVLDFPVPSGITFAKIDPETGLLASARTKDAYLEAFISGNEPTEYSFITKKKVSTVIPEEYDHGF
ncbi:MAG TPA: hypothetical protein DHV62_01940 [Elusimicrobia bacterium]|jgi:penicillin-binding protein 1A|nr:hypothetical protein [Elusimicrobiota bacterium]